MKKQILKVIVPALVVGTIAGCGGSSGNSKSTSNHPKISKEAVTIDGLKALQSSIKPQKFSTKNVKTLQNSYKADSSSNQDTPNNRSCSQGGNLSFSPNSEIMKISANNCKEEGLLIDGALSIDQKSEDSGTISVDRTINIVDTTEGETNTLVINKGGKISSDGNNANIDLSMKVNGTNIDIENLKLSIDKQNQSFGFDDGVVQIDKYSFIVVDQKEDFKTDKDGNISGLLELKDGAGHKIELEATNSALLLKIDENGDGSFSQNEILSNEEIFNNFLEK